MLGWSWADHNTSRILVGCLGVAIIKLLLHSTLLATLVLFKHIWLTWRGDEGWLLISFGHIGLLNHVMSTLVSIMWWLLDANLDVFELAAALLTGVSIHLVMWTIVVVLLWDAVLVGIRQSLLVGVWIVWHGRCVGPYCVVGLRCVGCTILQMLLVLMLLLLLLYWLLVCWRLHKVVMVIQAWVLVDFDSIALTIGRVSTLLVLLLLIVKSTHERVLTRGTTWCIARRVEWIVHDQGWVLSLVTIGLLAGCFLILLLSLALDIFLLGTVIHLVGLHYL